jgi:hypothetical protein
MGRQPARAELRRRAQDVPLQASVGGRGLLPEFRETRASSSDGEGGIPTCSGLEPQALQMLVEVAGRGRG